MRTLLALLLVMALPQTAAAADDERELLLDGHLRGALGTTADHTGGTADISTQSARASLDTGGDLRLTIPELHLGDPWYKPVIGIGGTVDTELIGALCGGCDAERSLDLQGAVEGRVHATWFTGSYRETYQRPVKFSDGFWRNERGTIRRTIGASFTGMGFDNGTADATIAPIDWERRELFRSELSNYFEPTSRLGDEHHWSIALGRVLVFNDDESAIAVEVLDTHFGHYVVPGAADADDTNTFPLYMTPNDAAIQAFELDVTALAMRFTSPEHSVLGFGFGMTSRRPAAQAGINDAETSVHADYFIGYGQSIARDHVPGWERFGERRPRHREVGYLVQLEDFHRIDPTGLAADLGHQLGVDVAWGPFPTFTVSGKAAVVGARRKIISPLRAPEAQLLAEVGDWLIMGRMETQADWEFHPAISLTANAWLERSDRADPLRPAIHGAVVPLDTHAGLWLGVSFHPF